MIDEFIAACGGADGEDLHSLPLQRLNLFLQFGLIYDTPIVVLLIDIALIDLLPDECVRHQAQFQFVDAGQAVALTMAALASPSPILPDEAEVLGTVRIGGGHSLHLDRQGLILLVEQFILLLDLNMHIVDASLDVRIQHFPTRTVHKLFQEVLMQNLRYFILQEAKLGHFIFQQAVLVSAQQSIVFIQD